jgi:hypothetical protein
VNDEMPESTIVIHQQLKTGVFVNARGQIVIRQTDDFQDDQWVIISVEHVPALVAAIAAAAASPEAGFRQLEDEPELDLPEPEPQPKTIYTPPPDRRELIIAALQAGGQSNREIARSLNCSEATVRRVAATLVRPGCDSGATLAPPDAADDASMTHLFSSEKEGQAA